MQIVVSEDGTRIAYDVVGEGRPVICIFGATCFRTFLPVKGDVKTFAQRFRVINYDRRGRGDSGNQSPWSLEREIEDLEALIDANGGTVSLYGHSSGAVLALEASLRLGTKVERAIIHDASYVSDDVDRAEFTALAEDVDSLLRAGKNGRAIKRFLTGIGMPRAFALMLPLFPGWGTMKRLAPTLRYDIVLTEAPPQYDRFTRIEHPVMILAGEKNPAAIHRVYERLVATIPGATGHVLAGQDHLASAKVLLPMFDTFFSSKD